jgi:hypothetical protein
MHMPPTDTVEADAPEVEKVAEFPSDEHRETYIAALVAEKKGYEAKAAGLAKRGDDAQAGLLQGPRERGPGRARPARRRRQEAQPARRAPVAARAAREATFDGSFDLTDLDSVRAFLQYNAGDVDQDAVIEELITAASRAILEEFEREFAPATNAATRRFVFDLREPGSRSRPYDLRAVTASCSTRRRAAARR